MRSLVLLAVALLIAGTAMAEEALFGKFSGGAVPLQRINYGQCFAMAPADWQVAGVLPDGTALEIMARDGRASAGYMIIGVHGITRPVFPTLSTPETFLHYTISRGGTEQVEYGRASQDAFGYVIQPFSKANGAGVVIYRVVSTAPMDPDGYILISRVAEVQGVPWDTDGPIALRVAMSIRCVATIAPTGDAQSQRAVEDRHESAYNMQLGMEDVHDPSTGQSYWVSPSTDWWETGPYGPGYYKQYGNNIVKLEPGMAR